MFGDRHIIQDEYEEGMTFAKDYKTDKQGTKEEQVFIESNTKKHYQKGYSQWFPYKP